MTTNVYLDSIEIGDGFIFLNGWLIAAPKSSLKSIQVTIDGRKFSPVYLEARQDLLEKKLAAGPNAIMAAFPIRPDTDQHHVALADERGNFIPIWSKVKPTRFVPRGAIDQIDSTNIRGWIFDPGLILSGEKPVLSFGEGHTQALTLGFDRSDVPYTFYGHEKRYGFHADVRSVMKQAQSPTGSRDSNIKIGLISRGQRIASASIVNPQSPALSAKPSASAGQESAVRSLSSQASSAENGRRKMLVVSWDMGHNPIGRAYLLAHMARKDFDVKLIGPIFEQYGTKLWEPLATQADLNIETFRGGPLAEYLEQAWKQVEAHAADVVYVSKPRLPSLIFGFMMRLRHNATVLVDVDDHELSFFKETDPLNLKRALKKAASDPQASKMPFENVWTQLSEELLRHADGITVSNIALQDKFGGIIVRHARDEAAFSVSSSRRREVRREFELSDNDRAIVFIGTPRPHKGIFRIADALERLNDKRLLLVLVGSFTDARTKKQFEKYKKARIKFFENQPWVRLPELVSMGDLIAILQDEKARISEFQIPAKLTDALALGIPTVVTKVPPIADLLSSDAFLGVEDNDDLDQVLRKFASTKDPFPTQRRKARALYLSEFSYAVNSARIKLAVEDADRTKESSSDTEMRETVTQIVKFAGVDLPLSSAGRLGKPAVHTDSPKRDIVFFWKQNDSDLYGRRSDMLVSYLLKTGKFRRAVHFDRSLTLSELEASIDRSPQAHLHQGNLVYLNSVKRILKMADREPIIRRTFLCRSGSAPQSFLGLDLPPQTAYPDFVKATLKEHGIDSRPLAWVWPVVFDFPQVNAQVPFDKIVVDIIDDQRKWTAKPDYLKRVSQNYVDLLSVGDVVVANCRPVKEGFSNLRKDILVVPNGAEEFALDRNWTMPDDLVTLRRPIVGYVGNLRDRIDFGLIEEMARRHPEWSIVLVGSAQGASDILRLAEIPNIHLTGVRPYHEALQYIKSFDVAIMPHLDNELSQNMNPLKLYVYFALGVPVVTTEVANIKDISPFVVTAAGHSEFIKGVDRILQGEVKSVSLEERRSIVEKVSWSARVAKIIDEIGL